MTISYLSMIISNMAKYRKGDRCKVIKNALAPNFVGYTVVIDSIAIETPTSVLYRVINEDIMGYASEKCLERYNP